MTENIKYSYHRMWAPEHEGDYVMTLARRVEGNTVKLGWAICYPGRWVEYEGYAALMVRNVEATRLLRASQLEGLTEVEKALHKGTTLYSGHPQLVKVKGLKLDRGDTFSKAKGRELALRRLHQSPILLTRKEGQHAVDAAINYLASREYRLDRLARLDKEGEPALLLTDIAQAAKRERVARLEAKEYHRKYDEAKNKRNAGQGYNDSTSPAKSFMGFIKGVFGIEAS